MMMDDGHEWDLFLSHASEDKDSIVLPLADALTRAGARVWLDAWQLIPGDSIRRRIDDGLLRSRRGIVVVSPAFLRKPWAQAELDALFSQDLASGNTLIPIWHGVTRDEVAAASPLLAARLALSTAEGIEAICGAVLRALDVRRVAQRRPEEEVDLIELFRRGEVAKARRRVHRAETRQPG